MRATDEALSTADRVTLTGSTIPAAAKSPYSSVLAFSPWPAGSSLTLCTATAPSNPAFAAIRREAETVFDFGETAKRALGRHWQPLAEKDRQEFTSLFSDLIERAYISKIERYSGERITYTGESMDGAVASVRTRFVTKQGTEIPIDYRMQQRGDRWLVYDVVVEGISLINNYRTQFDKIIKTSSYAELVRRLKAAEVAAPAAPKS